MRKKTEDKYTIYTSMDNRTAELVELECSNCGATLEIIDKTHAKCPFCGQTFLIDEAKGTVIDINIDYGDSAKVQNTLKSTKFTLIIFLAIIAFIVVIVLGVNIAANFSMFSSSDRDNVLGNNSGLLEVFCEDIFEKEYEDITLEEFASIRYIRYDYDRDINDSFHVIEYSFTNYEDCSSEEEFQDTVQRWTYSSSGVAYPTDFSMFTGLKRIDTTDSFYLSGMTLSKEAKISYVATDNQLEVVTSLLNPEDVKVLHISMQSDDLKGIEEYKNLEELEMGGYAITGNIDVTGIQECTKLKKLVLDCGTTYSGLEGLRNLKNMRSLYINGVELKDSSFLEGMPELEELHINSGESGDLSILSKVPKLKRLYFMDSEPIDPAKLSVLPDLEELKLEIEEKEALRSIAKLTNLKSLDLHLTIFLGYDEAPVDVSVLAELPNLEELTITNFWDEDITGMESIFNKQTMKSISIGEYTSINVGMKIILNEELLIDNPSLENLKMVGWKKSVDSSQVEENYDILLHYPNLKKLGMSQCNLSSIEFMSQLPNLEVVNLQGNEVMDFSPLLSCKKLQRLYVYEDSLDKIAFPESVEVITEWVANEREIME